MFIPVVLKGGKEELVSKDELQFLIFNQQILFFKRSDGWAVVGRDKMRGHETHAVDTERRKHKVFAVDYEQ